MPDLSRRQVLGAAAAGAGAMLAPVAWTATPAYALAANDLSLWYRESAGTDWLRALPISNGRLGAMVFGNTDTERLQLNEDTVWAGGPHDYSNPQGAGALAQIRQLVFANQWSQAQSLIDQNMLGRPAGQLAHQPVGDVRLAFPTGSGASEYNRNLDLTGNNDAIASLKVLTAGSPIPSGYVRIANGTTGLAIDSGGNVAAAI